MRVLLADSGREWRGGQQQVFLLARELRIRGHLLHMVTPTSSPLAARISRLGIDVTSLRGRTDLDLLAAFRLARLSINFGPDIIHCHDSRSHAIAQLAVFIFRAPGTLVVTRRSSNTPGGGSKYRHVTRFMAVSKAVVNSLIRAGVPPDRIDLVYSGVEAAPEGSRKVKSRPTPGGSHRHKIVTIAALEKEKGLDLLLAAAAKLAQTDNSISWTVVGDGSQKSRLEKLQRKRRAPVKFVGWHEDVTPFLAEADLMVHPARSEALGTAVLEALGHGIPVVATRVGGIPEIIDDEVGALVESGQPAELSTQVLACLENQNLRNKVLEAGPRVARRFGVDKMVDGVLACYEKCLTKEKKTE